MVSAFLAYLWLTSKTTVSFIHFPESWYWSFESFMFLWFAGYVSLMRLWRTDEFFGLLAFRWPLFTIISTRHILPVYIPGFNYPPANGESVAKLYLVMLNVSDVKRFFQALVDIQSIVPHYFVLGRSITTKYRLLNILLEYGVWTFLAFLEFLSIVCTVSFIHQIQDQFRETSVVKTMYKKP